MKLVIALLVLAAAPAWAQSTRYPPDASDEDREAETHSKVWEQALSPQRAPYEALVRDARPLVEEHEPPTTDDLVLAVSKLDQAIGKLPAAPEAYALRGEAYLKLAKISNQIEQWTKCADDLGAADDRLNEAGDRTQLHLWLGLCAARAGKLGRAEEVLARTAATATSHRGELYTRLGEVRIALGKLDEAIDALGVALDTNEYLPALGHWLLAAAYDRSRRNTEALAQLQAALLADSSLGTVEYPNYPFIGTGETDYLEGLTYPVDTPGSTWQPRPELAIVHFRHFLELAPQSPWRRRAEEHLHELAALDLPQAIERDRNSTTMADMTAVRASIHKFMPELRACMAKLPATVFRVTITKDGPHLPEARDRTHVNVPPDGERADLAIDLDKSNTEAATSCIDQAVRRHALPAPAEHDTWYRVSFYVISP